MKSPPESSGSRPTAGAPGPAVERAASLLSDDARRFEPVSRENADLAAAAAARAIRARVARRARRRWTLGVCAAAAAVVALAGASRAPHLFTMPRASTASVPIAPASVPDAVVSGVQGNVLVIRGGATSRVADGSPARAGDRILALQGGSAALTLPSGTRLVVESGGDVAWLEHGSSLMFAISAGALRADVAPLGPDERFIVRTDDAEVEARGASFRVAHAPSDATCGGGTSTRVDVFAGIASVRAGDVEKRVEAGGKWPQSCDVARPPELQPSVAARPQVTSASPLAPAAPPSRAVPSRASDLAAQNDLFDEALAAERRGDDVLALATLDRFARRYPSGPLAENALAERIKILRKTNPERARDAAREYLQKYPSGFAHNDAQMLVDAHR